MTVTRVTGTQTVLRLAEAADAAAVADVYLRSYDAALPTVRRAHSDDGVRAYIRDLVVPRGTTWVADGAGAVRGMMVLDGDWIGQLYLDPDHRGRGIGDLFVRHAKALSPGGLQLWTFQVNAPAHRFYERHGFAVAERTDGSANEEREPDVRYVWAPAP
ncbi:GNAT family N-acetyltransferase [Streptomyces sp. NPDC050504]|uniref:GNAT family N-acetyltransferase n=1 Tax=Streptomyces sp. NPDC050504 TaxID=3365618 RepID=UPI0037A55081